MISISELTNMFFKDLKSYNVTNFKTIEKMELGSDDATLHKSFSAVITRFFIFVERHPELSSADTKMLYYKLKIDMIARYFSQYPATSFDDLKPFQTELRNYSENLRRGIPDESIKIRGPESATA